MRGSEREKEDKIKALTHELGVVIEKAGNLLVAEHWPAETEYLSADLRDALRPLKKVFEDYWEKWSY